MRIVHPLFFDRIPAHDFTLVLASRVFKRRLRSAEGYCRILGFTVEYSKSVRKFTAT